MFPQLTADIDFSSLVSKVTILATKHPVWKKKKNATFDTWQLQRWFKHENWVELHADQESSINKFEIGPPGGQKPNLSGGQKLNYLLSLEVQVPSQPFF